MDGIYYKKNKNIGTLENVSDEMEQLQMQREDYKNISLDEKLSIERDYIENSIKIIKDKCNAILKKAKFRAEGQALSSTHLKKLEELEKKWNETNDKLLENVLKQDNVEMLIKASNHICELVASIDNKDFRTYNILPIWDAKNQPTGLEQAVQNYELILDDYLNTLGSKGIEKFDKTREGYEYRQRIDQEFEDAVLKFDIEKVKECIDKGAYVDLQLNGDINTALNYAIMDAKEDLENTTQVSQNKKVELAKLLLENGADSTIKYYYGEDSDREMRVEKEVEPLSKAIKMGNYELVSLMLRNNEQIDLKMLEKILDSEDVLFTKRVLNEIVVKGAGRRARMPRRLRNYISRSDDKDFIISMYNNGLVSLEDVSRIFMERPSITLLKVMDELGYEFDFSSVTERFMLRMMLDRADKECINYVLDKFVNFSFQNYLENDGNVQLIKKHIEVSGDFELLEKIYEKDPKLDLRSFNIEIPNYIYTTESYRYLNKLEEFKKKGVNISYEGPGVSKNFDNYILKMIQHDKSYKEDDIPEETLLKVDKKGNTVFHYIAMFGDLEDLKKIQENINFNINQQNRYGYTPLSCAIKANNKDIINELVSRGGLDWNIDLGLNINPYFSHRNTYLTEAINANNLELAKRIIKRFKPEEMEVGNRELKVCILSNATDIAKEIIDKCTGREEFDDDIIMFATQYGNLDIVQELLNKKMYVDTEVEVQRRDSKDNVIDGIEVHREEIKLDVNKTDELGNSALFEAVKNQDTKMIRLLVKNNANIDMQNMLFETPLMYAVKHNLKDSIKELIDLGANLLVQEYSGDKMSGTGKTVLHYAKDKEVLQELISNGANPYKKDAKGRYAFDVERLTKLHEKLGDEIRNPNFDEDTVNKILDEIGDDINTPIPYRTNFTAVSYAAYKGNVKILDKIIQHGGNINAMDNGHTDALMCSLIAHKEDSAMYLIDKGINLEHSDRIGNNALMMAIYNGFDKVAEKIIEKGVDLEKNTKFGNPLLVAIECKRVNIIKKLIDNNVNINVKNAYGISADKLIENLKNEYTNEDKEYKILDNILKNTKKDKSKEKDISLEL